MRVAIVGAGGLGSIYGGVLARGGENVTFIARGAVLEALQANGLTVRLASGEEFHLNAQATSDPKEVGSVDLIWFCVKSYDVDNAARMAQPMVGPDTLILPVQNGIDAPSRIASIVGTKPVLGCRPAAGATLEAPGLVVQKGRHIRATLGELKGGISPRVEALAAILRKDGIDAVPSANIRGEIWEKYVSFSGQCGTSALTRLPLDVLWAGAETRDLMLGIMDEVRAIARAKGIKMPEGAAERAVSRSSSLAGTYPSTYFDLIAGKRLEIEASYGTAIRLGRETGVPTPICSTMYALLKPFENGTPEAPPAAATAAR